MSDTFDNQSEPAFAYLEKPVWKIRRRIIILSLLFIGGNLQFIIIKGTDTALYAQIALGLLGAGVAIIGSYVFGVNWDNANFNNMLASAQGIKTPATTTSSTSTTVAVPIMRAPAKIVTSDNAAAVKNNPTPPPRDEEED